MLTALAKGANAPLNGTNVDAVLEWTESGGITHDVRKEAPARPEVLYLSDNAAFGYALMRMYEVTGKAEYLARASALASFLLAELADRRGARLCRALPAHRLRGVHAQSLAAGARPGAFRRAQGRRGDPLRPAVLPALHHGKFFG